jgi:hypothetical protein
MSTAPTELPSSLLQSWISELNRDLGWEGKVDDEGFCVFNGKDGQVVVVQADDRTGGLRFSAEVGGPVADADTVLPATLLTANYRGASVGAAYFSLHPEDRRIQLELVWGDPDRGGIDRFATLAARFSQLADLSRQRISNGTLGEIWTAAAAPGPEASGDMIRA